MLRYVQPEPCQDLVQLCSFLVRWKVQQESAPGRQQCAALKVPVPIVGSVYWNRYRIVLTTLPVDIRIVTLHVILVIVDSYSAINSAPVHIITCIITTICITCIITMIMLLGITSSRDDCLNLDEATLFFYCAQPLQITEQLFLQGYGQKVRDDNIVLLPKVLQMLR